MSKVIEREVIGNVIAAINARGHVFLEDVNGYDRNEIEALLERWYLENKDRLELNKRQTRDGRWAYVIVKQINKQDIIYLLHNWKRLC